MKVGVICAAASAAVLLACVTPGVAGQVDVEVWLSPVLTPGGSDTRTGEPPKKLTVDPPAPTFFLEVWATDDGDTNTGIVSAYFDITWDDYAMTGDSTGLTHSSLFALFPEGAQVPGAPLVENFGGSDGTFAGQGIEPTIVRIGYVAFATNQSVGSIDFDAVVGLGGVGVFGRSVGEVLIHTGTLNQAPEPASLLLLSAGLPILRRRAHG